MLYSCAMGAGHGNQNSIGGVKSAGNQPHAPISLNQFVFNSAVNGFIHSYRKNTRINNDICLSIQNNIQNQNLNDAQLTALLHTEGPLLIRAGAGTGKTKVMACKIVKLIEMGVIPRRILAATFTNEATDEMNDRARLIRGQSCKGTPTIKTIHGLCLLIVKAHLKDLGLKDSTRMIGDSYKIRFIKNAMEDNSQATFDGLAKIRGNKPHKQVLAQISSWKNSLLTPDDVTNKYEECQEKMRKYILSGSNAVPPENPYELHEVYRKFEWYKNNAGMIDPDDLLLLANKAFTQLDNSPQILNAWQNHYDFILVDEAQDINRAQFNVLKLLAQKYENITFVGDDDQSIYCWRGADVELFRNIPQQFNNVLSVNLTEHYRCTAPILALSNKLMEADKNRFTKKLDAVKKTGEAPQLIRCHDHIEEAQFVASKIAELVKENKCKLEDIVILSRRKKAFKSIEPALVQAGIPYKLIDNPEVVDHEIKQNIYAMFEVLHNPIEKGYGFIPLIESSIFSISKKENDRLSEMLVRGVFDNYWDALRSETFQDSLSKESSLKVKELVTIVEKLHKEVTELTFPDKLGSIADKVIKVLYPASTKKENWKKVSDPTFELKIMQDISSHFEGWEKTAKNPTFDNYIGWIYRLKMFEKAPIKTADGAVTLASIHAWKGLEKKVVFIIAMVEGICPSEFAIERENDMDSVGIDEERRVAYVGMTRPQDRLFITYSDFRPNHRGKPTIVHPSRFIFESGAHELNNSFVEVTPVKPVKTVEAKPKIKKRPRKKKFDDNQTDFLGE